MTQISSTIPDHVDDVLVHLSDNLKVSKSSLIALCIELGLNVYIQGINNRAVCISQLNELLEVLAADRAKEIGGGTQAD